MSMIKSIKVENFRQFDKIEVDNFKRVNFLVGENNCGKTTVLEALYWCGDPVNMNLFNAIYVSRKMNFNQSWLPTFFYKKNENLPIDIDVEFIDERVNSSFHLGFKMSLPKNESQTIEVGYNDAQKTFNKKEYNYIFTNTYGSAHNSSMSKYHYKLVADGKGISLQPQGSVMKTPEFRASLLYIPSEFKHITVHQHLDYLISESKEEEFVKYLQVFNSKVSWVGFGADNEILIETTEENQKFKLPLNLMGDGFVKFFMVIIVLLDNRIQTHAILLDEIENGLHFKNIKNLIRAILKLSKEMNIQMFITTHSYETLKFLSEIMQEDDFNSQKDEVQVINIANTKLKGFQSYNYTMDGLIEFIETETEIRD